MNFIFWKIFETNITNIISTRGKMGRWKIDNWPVTAAGASQRNGLALLAPPRWGGSRLALQPACPKLAKPFEHFLLLLSLLFCTSFSPCAPLNSLLSSHWLEWHSIAKAGIINVKIQVEIGPGLCSCATFSFPWNFMDGFSLSSQSK